MVNKKLISHEILTSFWKVHVLHHAEEGGVVGTWMLDELREHGYDVSAGTLYPMLRRLEGFGWLSSSTDGEGSRARRTYFITDDGKEVLGVVKRQLRELGVELRGKM
jgi:DNA-binding PadR family transcriptional regulator